jgi:hypothetical protein
MRQVTQNSSFEAQADGKLSIPAIGLNIGGGVTSKTGVNDVATNTSNHIQETVGKVSSQLKADRQTKVSESREYGSEQRVTRKITNPNMCHGLNLDYFEILANYAVTTSLDKPNVKLCILLENPLIIVPSRQLLRMEEHILRPVLRAPNLAGGFDAARLLDARDRACVIICGACQCAPDGGQTAVDVAWQQVDQALTMMGQDATSLLSYSNSKEYGDYLFRGVKPPDLNLAIYHFKSWVFVRGLEEIAWELMSQIEETAFHKFGQSDADRLWYLLQAQAANFFDLPTLYKNYQSIFDKLSQDWANSQYPFATGFVVSSVGGLADGGIRPDVQRFSDAYKAYLNAVAAANTTATTPSPTGIDPQSAALDAFPAKDVAVAMEQEDSLLRHIGEQINYYRFVLWQALDSGTRSQMLRIMGLPTFADPIALAYEGNDLAFALDPDPASPLGEWITDNITNNLPDILDRSSLSQPTTGVMIDTRLSPCDACEDYVEQLRAAEIALRQAEARKAAAMADQEEQETERFKARLAQTPPLLTDPEPGQADLRLTLDNKTSNRDDVSG